MTTRLKTVTDQITINLYISDCPACGVIFGIPESLEERRREDHKSFYCPNGHSMAWSGPSKVERERNRLKEELAAERSTANFFREAHASQVERAMTAERSLAATRGQVTKLKKRAVAGTCPFGCKRHFVNLERHVAGQHAGQELPG